MLYDAGQFESLPEFQSLGDKDPPKAFPHHFEEAIRAMQKAVMKNRMNPGPPVNLMKIKERMRDAAISKGGILGPDPAVWGAPNPNFPSGPRLPLSPKHGYEGPPRNR